MEPVGKLTFSGVVYPVLRVDVLGMHGGLILHLAEPFTTANTSDKMGMLEWRNAKEPVRFDRQDEPTKVKAKLIY